MEIESEILVLIIVGIVLIAFISLKTSKKDTVEIRVKEQKEKVQKAFDSKDITERHRQILLGRIEENRNNALFIIDDEVNKVKDSLKREQMLLEKYGPEVGNKLVNYHYWIGMTPQQLIDCKGRPTKIEKEILKTKTKEIFIYGTKSSGDYFVIENDAVVKIVDR